MTNKVQLLRLLLSWPHQRKKAALRSNSENDPPGLQRSDACLRAGARKRAYQRMRSAVTSRRSGQVLGADPSSI
jgi:hypothetical protein